MASRTHENITARFEREEEWRCYLTALSAHGLLVAAFALLCHGLLPAPLFLLVGLMAYVRNFNAMHEASHAVGSTRNFLRWARPALMIVHSPLQLGYRELAHNHHLHHAFPCDPVKDPDASLNTGQWYTAAPFASVQPELAALQMLRRTRHLGKRLRELLVYNCAMSATLVALAGTNILWWILVTRLGSLATWFIFDWILHHPRVFPKMEPRPLPMPVQWLWSALFSRDNLNASRFHTLHHAHPHVPSRQLPLLFSLIAGDPAPIHPHEHPPVGQASGCAYSTR